MASTAPPFLQKGDTILLIATARKVSREEMQPAIAQMRDWGLQVEEGPSLYKSYNQFAGNDSDRAGDLQWALNHARARAIIVARGGYGTLRILDLVNFEKFHRSPKWMIGYSDVTVLHNKLYHLGYQSLHATMPINFPKHAGATGSLRHLLFGEKGHYQVAAHPLNRKGLAKGDIVGGNLSLLYALKGQDFRDCRGKILFLEDLDEYLYHIDRMILSLKRAGCFDGLAGLVVGGMSGMRDNPIPFGSSAEEIISHHLAEYDFPVCFGFPAGHIDENLAFYHGASYTLQVNNDGARLQSD